MAGALLYVAAWLCAGCIVAVVAVTLLGHARGGERSVGGRVSTDHGGHAAVASADTLEALRQIAQTARDALLRVRDRDLASSRSP